MDESRCAETGHGALIKSALEVAPVFTLAGFGMVISGSLLDWVSSSWQVFQDVPSLLILVPALLGLKGNLEMTLGARLGTHANNKDLESDRFCAIVASNLMAVQCQAIVVGAFAALLAIVETYAATGAWVASHALLLSSSAITAASVASLVLSLLMIGIVVIASRAGIDPDNITAPVAGMLGDFCTLGIVCLVAKYFWVLPPPAFAMLNVLLLVYLVIAILCGVGAYRASYTVEIMKYGWYPVLASMLLSNLSGPISENSISKFNNFARFQVVMNGAGGNLGSILAAKLSTDLHIAENHLLDEPEEKVPQLRGPLKSLSKQLSLLCKTQEDVRQSLVYSGDPHMDLATSWVSMARKQTYMRNWLTLRMLTGAGEMVRFARMLLCLIIPGQALCACFVVGFATGWTALPTPMFLAFFIAGAACQVVILMVCARTSVVVCWRMKIDPDNAASPLVCGMGDLVGTSLMTVAFMIVQYLGGQAWNGGGL